MSAFSLDVTLSALNQAAGLVARDSTAANTYYVGRILQTTQGATPAVVAAIYRYANGGATLIGTSHIIANASLAIGSSDALEFDVEGSSLKLFVNGALAAYAHDSVLTSGTVGIYTSGAVNGATIDSGFTASAIISGTVLPFNEAFNESTFANELPTATWVDQTGTFSIASGNGAYPSGHRP